jgi:hypothetical protein
VYYTGYRLYSHHASVVYALLSIGFGETVESCRNPPPVYIADTLVSVLVGNPRH